MALQPSSDGLLRKLWKTQCLHGLRVGCGDLVVVKVVICLVLK